MERSFNKAALLETLLPFIDEFHGFSIDDWEEENLIVTDNNEDFALFEYEGNGVYTGHMFMRTRTGKEAISFFTEALDFIFKSGATIVKGLTPINKKPARFMARKIGFESFGIINSVAGEMELFIMTKQDWDKRKEHE